MLTLNANSHLPLAETREKSSYATRHFGLRKTQMPLAKFTGYSEIADSSVCIFPNIFIN